MWHKHLLEPMDELIKMSLDRFACKLQLEWFVEAFNVEQTAAYLHITVTQQNDNLES